MTNTAIDTTTLRAAMAAAATAAAGTLPSGTPLAAAEPPGDEVPRDALLPAEARAATGDISGSATGKLVLLVSAELAASIERDPLGGGLAADVAPVMEQAAAALSQSSGLTLTLGAVTEAPAAGSLGDDDATDCVGVPILAGDAHAATLALVLDRAEAAPAGGGQAAAPAPEPAPEPEPEIASHEFQPLDALAAATAGGGRSLEFLGEVELGVTAELGRARLTVRNVLNLAPGSIVELDRTAGSPVDVLVNGTLIARGEVVVVDEEFGIRISEIVGRPPGES
jgi:flagellar motor switch protein FliN/FliY